MDPMLLVGIVSEEAKNQQDKCAPIAKEKGLFTIGYGLWHFYHFIGDHTQNSWSTPSGSTSHGAAFAWPLPAWDFGQTHVPNTDDWTKKSYWIHWKYDDGTGSSWVAT